MDWYVGLLVFLVALWVVIRLVRHGMAQRLMTAWAPPTEYVPTAIPTPGLDDLTAERAERELRGIIYRTERLVANAITDEARADAQRSLDALREYARKEGIEV